MLMQEVEILSGDDCYALRCSFLHEGSDDINGQSAQDVLERFVFTEPNEKNNFNHRNLINGNTLSLNVKLFCEEILVGIENWISNIKNDATKQQALNGMMKLSQFLPLNSFVAVGSVSLQSSSPPVSLTSGFVAAVFFLAVFWCAG